MHTSVGIVTYVLVISSVVSVFHSFRTRQAWGKPRYWIKHKWATAKFEKVVITSYREAMFVSSQNKRFKRLATGKN